MFLLAATGYVTLPHSCALPAFPFMLRLLVIVLLVYLLVALMTSPPRRQYSSSQLLSLRRDFPIPRVQRRALWFHKILRRPPKSPTNNVAKLRKPKQTSKPVPSLLMFNARSLFRKIDDLKIRASSHNCDLICITETWLDNSVADTSVSIPGYDLKRLDRDVNGGGVAIFLKSHLKLTIVNDLHVPGIKSNVLCCSLEDFDLLLVLVYHPYWGAVPAHSILVDFIQDIIDHSSMQRTLIAGDVNDLRLNLVDFAECNNFVQIVQHPTRGSNILDIVLTSHPLKFEVPICIAPLGRSDHKGVLVKCVDSSKASCKPSTLKVRSFSPSSYASCFAFLGSRNWDSFLDVDDIDLMVDLFQSLLLFCFDLFFPEKTVRMRSADPPWLTPALKALSDSRDKALNRGLYPKYLALREKFNSEIQKAKTRHFSRLKSGSPVEIWNSIKTQLKPSPQTHFDPSSASLLNDKFVDHFSQPDLHLFSCPSGSCVDPPSVSEFSVFHLLKKCKSSSKGADGLPGHFYRLFAFVLAKPLSIIYNRSLQTAVFPRQWKLAHLTPIPKGASDFRPISILPFASKVLERLVRDLVLLPSLSSPFDPRQFGFIPKSFGGCTNAVLSIRLTLLQHLSKDPCNSAHLLAVDFKKAFDSISHLTLLETLRDLHHCNPYTIKFVHSFLSDRFQRVACDGTFTNWKSVSSGVPQGSILGPLLFVLLINDLPSFDDTRIVAYADDITLLHCESKNTKSDFQSIVNSFCSWSESKKLKINVEKTKVMNVCRSSSPSNVTICINGTVIEAVENLKILGVFFSSDLQWNKQFEFLYNKLCRSLSCVKRLRSNGNPSDVIWQAYNGLVMCHLYFCWPIICDISQKHFRKFEKIDRIATRWANLTNIPCLKDRLDKCCIKLIHKVSLHKNVHPLSDFFDVRPIVNNTRHMRTLLPMRRKSRMYSRSFVKFSILS